MKAHVAELKGTAAHVLRALADGAWHSGESLANTIELSRASVWKAVEYLEDWGLSIVRERGRGYRLAKPLDLIDQQALKASLPAEISAQFSPPEVLLSVPSTNARLADWVKTAGRGRLLPGAICLAEHQSAGRGRRGRKWHSPMADNLYMSFAWRFDQGVAAMQGLSLAIGVAVADILEAQCDVTAVLKWPNDLLVNDAKLAGILVEIEGDASGPCDAIVGLGLNVAMSEASGSSIDQAWTCLERHSPSLPGRQSLTEALCSGLAELLMSYERDTFARWRELWNQRAAYVDQSVELRHGDRCHRGLLRGVDSQGAVIVENEDGARAFVGGELSLRPVS